VCERRLHRIERFRTDEAAVERGEEEPQEKEESRTADAVEDRDYGRDGLAYLK
jgi:hypothetical protein